MSLFDTDDAAGCGQPGCELDDFAPFGKDYASIVRICRKPGLIGGRIEWDELGQIPTLDRRPLRDHDVNALRELIANRVRERTKDGRMIPLDVDKIKLFDAVNQVAHESPYLPQAEYLLSLTWDRVPRLDLPYEEDVRAETDMNVVMTGAGSFVEVQGTAEGAAFDRTELNALLDLAASGCADLTRLQTEALS
jgi:hypothetical protein